MEKKIVFKTKNGGVAVITTAPNILTEINPDTGKLWTYEDIAKKDLSFDKNLKGDFIFFDSKLSKNVNANFIYNH